MVSATVFKTNQCPFSVGLYVVSVAYKVTQYDSQKKKAQLARTQRGETQTKVYSPKPNPRIQDHNSPLQNKTLTYSQNFSIVAPDENIHLSSRQSLETTHFSGPKY